VFIEALQLFLVNEDVKLTWFREIDYGRKNVADFNRLSFFAAM
jgi:hypothetical protein